MFTEAEKALLADMAMVGHSVTDRGAELLRRLHDFVSGDPPPSEEYPKMVYPDGSVHDESSERHLVGSPKGVTVNSEAEEAEIMGAVMVAPVEETP